LNLIKKDEEIKMKLHNIKKYLSLYSQEDYLFKVIGPRIKERGYVLFDEFYQIGMWKSARQKQNYLTNKNIVEEITKKAFIEKDETKKILKLCYLKGVSIPTASAILTIVFPKKYGIIDVRVIELLRNRGEKVNKTITPNTWVQYLSIVRSSAQENGITPRDVDKVLFAMHREELEEKQDYRNLYL